MCGTNTQGGGVWRTLPSGRVAVVAHCWTQYAEALRDPSLMAALVTDAEVRLDMAADPWGAAAAT